MTNTLQRRQVGAILDLESLLHTARRSSGMVVRAQFSAVVDQLRGLGEAAPADHRPSPGRRGMTVPPTCHPAINNWGNS